MKNFDHHLELVVVVATMDLKYSILKSNHHLCHPSCQLIMHMCRYSELESSYMYIPINNRKAIILQALSWSRKSQSSNGLQQIHLCLQTEKTILLLLKLSISNCDLHALWQDKCVLFPANSKLINPVSSNATLQLKVSWHQHRNTHKRSGLVWNLYSMTPYLETYTIDSSIN